MTPPHARGAVALALPPPPPTPAGPHALRRAEKYFRQGLLPEALEEYARFVAANPRHLAAAQVLGDLLVRAGRIDEAVGQYVRVAEYLHDRDPAKSAIVCRKILALKGSVRHQGVRATLFALCIERGDVDGAASYAARADEWRRVAEALLERGREADALSALERVLDDEAADSATRLGVARSLLSAGELDRARACLGATEDPELLLTVVELELLARDPAAARAAAARALRRDAALADRIVALSCSAAGTSRDAAFACLDAATDVLAGAGSWAEAARALEAYDAVVPGHVAALMKLVELCVDGEMQDPMRRAQVSLADAYIQAGRAREARVIAEDLALENPDDPVHIARFRRALELLGEPDPDAFIAERLSDSQPMPPMDGGWEEEPATAPTNGSGASSSPCAGTAGTGAARTVAAAANPNPGAVRVEAGNFGGAALLATATRLHEAGRADEAIDALHKAVRSREHRFAAALLLARIHRDLGDEDEAIEWFERARSEAPGPEAAHEVLYELAVALGAAGETDRAIAVFLELDVEAPGYRDVSTQMGRLKGRT